LILRDQVFARFVPGGLASPRARGTLLLLRARAKALLGWGPQFAVMTGGGAGATPLLFWLFGFLTRFLGYQPVTQSSFRPDREIRRGRN
jgi:hypothetical protein